MRSVSIALFAFILINDGAARAHVGANPSKATFTTPPEPMALPVDGGLTLAPYTFATADQNITVQWTTDFPTDPTGRFSFFYLDHEPPSSVTYDMILTLASPIPEASGDNGYWVSCTCSTDAGVGVVCPDAGPTGREPYCGSTQFVWDTSALPAGVYWIIAANFDPPYKIYTVSQGPVRVAHGGATPPPAVTVVLPDGLFAVDKSYTTLWLTSGVPPFHFDLFYGVSDESVVLDPPTPLGTDVKPIVNSDGSFGYLWDTSALSDGLYYFGVKVTDSTGQSSYTDSQFGENVYHPPDDGGLVIVGQDSGAADLSRPDLTVVLKNDNGGGCSCELGAGQSAVPLAAGLLAALFFVLVLRRRDDGR